MNKSITYPRLFLIIMSAVVLGGLIQWRIVGRIGSVSAGGPRTAVLATAGQTMDPIALEAEVVRLKGVAPSASVAMADVGFHFSNLWFAAQKENWPLATYYFNESRNHIRWLVRICLLYTSPSPRDS